MKPDAIYSTPQAAGMLAKLRKICGDLPEVRETVTFGHPTFQAAGKTFAVFEMYKGELGLALKVEKELQPVFLKDPRFYLTPYIGKHGWVTLRMNGQPLEWKEVRDMLKGSHHLVVRDRQGKGRIDRSVSRAARRESGRAPVGKGRRVRWKET